ncbi:Holliday junction resolvase RecU [Mycoplasma hafezii]|uniref:Holliday junction resolvase RecU n=1 Tax=Mycoplasma hafezii TaxID=525886 RepID=UPI003CFB81A8
MSQKNKGMFLEEVLNRSLNYYAKNDIAFIEKKSLPFLLTEVSKAQNNESKKSLKGYLFKKSTVDYIGMFQGMFVCFEAKSCKGERFDYKNIKQHQIEYLNLIATHGGLAYLIFYFETENKFVKTDPTWIYSDMKFNKSISVDRLIKISVVLEFEFPGIVNIFK